MLKNKSFLKIMDFTKEELEYLLDLSQELKSAKKNRTEEKKLIGKISLSYLKKTPLEQDVLMRLLPLIKEPMFHI